MTALRRIATRRPTFTLAMIVLTLALRSMVPAGFMIRSDGVVLTVTLCADASGAHQTRQIVIPRESPPGSRHAAKSGETCAFASLWGAGLGAIAPTFMVAVLAFLLVRGLAPVTAPRLTLTAYLRPPLRAPPALA